MIFRSFGIGRDSIGVWGQDEACRCFLDLLLLFSLHSELLELVGRFCVTKHTLSVSLLLDASSFMIYPIQSIKRNIPYKNEAVIPRTLAAPRRDGARRS